MGAQGFSSERLLGYLDFMVQVSYLIGRCVLTRSIEGGLVTVDFQSGSSKERANMGFQKGGGRALWKVNVLFVPRRGHGCSLARMLNGSG